jgi:hypothetical protein
MVRFSVKAGVIGSGSCAPALGSVTNPEATLGLVDRGHLRQPGA